MHNLIEQVKLICADVRLTRQFYRLSPFRLDGLFPGAHWRNFLFIAYKFQTPSSLTQSKLTTSCSGNCCCLAMNGWILAKSHTVSIFGQERCKSRDVSYLRPPSAATYCPFWQYVPVRLIYGHCIYSDSFATRMKTNLKN